MILTGDMMDAKDAEKAGLVAKIFPPEQLTEEAIKTGESGSRGSTRHNF